MKNAKSVKVLKIVVNVILWAFLIFAMLMTIMVITSTSNSEGLPKLFGKYVMTISSDSMKPEFKAGDLILDVPFAGQDARNNLEKGDIITFYADLNSDGTKDEINTHRIIEVIKNNNGTTTYQTKGDNNDIQDGYKVEDTDVIGKYTGTKIAGVGGVIAFLRTSLGFFLCIILPLVLFFLWELYSFIKTLVAVKAQKAAEAGITPDIEEAIRQKAIEDYLKEQSAKATEKTEKPEDSEQK